MFLVIALLIERTNLEEQKSFKAFIRLYNIGLPFMVIMFYVHGIVQVLGVELSKGANASISGIAGIAHIIMTIAIVIFFMNLRKVEVKN